MINLLKFQFRNLYKQPFTYVCIVIPLLISFLFNYMNRLVLIEQHPSIIESFVSDRIGVGIFGIIFICLFMCLDSDNYITKNIISRGYSRINLFLSKFIVVTIVMMISTILECIFMNFYVHDTNFWSTLGQILILILPQIALYITLSTLVNNNVVSVILCFNIDLIIGMVFIILSFLIGINKLYLVDETLTKLLSYWVNSLYDISSVPKTILLSLGWTTLLTSISIFIANKKDIK